MAPSETLGARGALAHLRSVAVGQAQTSRQFVRVRFKVLENLV